MQNHFETDDLAAAQSQEGYNSVHQNFELTLQKAELEEEESKGHEISVRETNNLEDPE